MIEYLDKVYFFDGTPRMMGDAPNIMCIGGDAKLAKRLRERRPKAVIALVEASAGTASKLAQYAHSRRMADHVFHAALAASRGPVKIHCYPGGTANSLWAVHKFDHRRPAVAPVLVDGMPLGDLLDMAKFATCDMLFMNCEGAELFALRQLCAEPGLVDRVQQMCCGTHRLHQPIYTDAVLSPLVCKLSERYLIDSHTRYHQGKPSLEYMLFRRLPH